MTFHKVVQQHTWGVVEFLVIVLLQFFDSDSEIIS